MTEAEWLTATDPTPMLEFLKGKASDRKLRLAVYGAARLLPSSRLPDSLLDTLEVAEAYADGQISTDELNVWRGIRSVPTRRDWPALDLRHLSNLLVCARKMLWQSCVGFCAYTVRCRISEVAGRHWEKEGRERRIMFLRWERTVIVSLLRCIFGNPFRAVTSDVRILAEGIYREKAFDRMPILADALQDAGCDNEDVLNHCRQPAEHVRGCWVVDLLTDRE
jgi:hypothetical protein